MSIDSEENDKPVEFDWKDEYHINSYTKLNA